MYDSYSILDNHAALNKFKVLSGKTLRDCNYAKSGEYIVKRKELIQHLFQKVSIDEWEQYRSLFYPHISMSQVTIDVCKKMIRGNRRQGEGNRLVLDIIHSYNGLELLIFLFEPSVLQTLRVSELY